MQIKQTIEITVQTAEGANIELDSVAGRRFIARIHDMLDSVEKHVVQCAENHRPFPDLIEVSVTTDRQPPR